MTAEIAVANRAGVALAADSAVTVRAEQGDKIWRTANKLFHLSKVHPVGLMVYGAADLAGVPWETLVKVYRHELAGKSFDSLTEYTNDFVQFLNSRASMFDDSVQEFGVRERARSTLLDIRDIVDRAVEREFSAGETVTGEVINVILKIVVKNWLPKVGEAECFEGFAGTEREILTRYRPAIRAAVEDVFGRFPLTAATRNSLARLVAKMETLAPSAGRSGVVIAGFGDLELFPVIDALQVDGVVLDRPRIRHDVTERVTPQNGASIVPFAQRDEVSTFMEGMSPLLVSAVDAYWDSVIDGLPSIVAKIAKVPQATREAITEGLTTAVRTLVTNFRDSIHNLQRQRIVMPILRSVAVVPKDELAAMAEALVELTSFRRRVDISTSETVGGAIDVAVISKGDGFVWIKRKHYFDMSLNPHWHANYLKGT